MKIFSEIIKKEPENKAAILSGVGRLHLQVILLVFFSYFFYFRSYFFDILILINLRMNQLIFYQALIYGVELVTRLRTFFNLFHKVLDLILEEIPSVIGLYPKQIMELLSNNQTLY